MWAFIFTSYGPMGALLSMFPSIFGIIVEQIFNENSSLGKLNKMLNGWRWLNVAPTNQNRYVSLVPMLFQFKIIEFMLWIGWIIILFVALFLRGLITLMGAIQIFKIVMLMVTQIPEIVMLMAIILWAVSIPIQVVFLVQFLIGLCLHLWAKISPARIPDVSVITTAGANSCLGHCATLAPIMALWLLGLFILWPVAPLAPPAPNVINPSLIFAYCYLGRSPPSPVTVLWRCT